MKFAVRKPNPPHTRFAAVAFDSSLGKSIRFNLPDGSVAATLVDARIDSDGADLIFEIEDPEAEAAFRAVIADRSMTNMSIVDPAADEQDLKITEILTENGYPT